MHTPQNQPFSTAPLVRTHPFFPVTPHPAPTTTPPNLEFDFDFAVYIGRFQPIHNGHSSLISHGLSIAKTLIIVIGSSNLPRSLKNPFSPLQRQQLILDSLHPSLHPRVLFIHQPDLGNTSSWQREVSKKVATLQSTLPHHKSPTEHTKTTLLSHIKDADGSYQTLFPQWHTSHCPNFQSIHATDIRNLLYQLILQPHLSPELTPPLQTNLHPTVYSKLIQWTASNSAITQSLSAQLLYEQNSPHPAPPYPSFFNITSLISYTTSNPSEDSTDNSTYILLNRRPSPPNLFHFELPTIHQLQLSNKTYPYASLAARPLWRTLSKSLSFSPSNHPKPLHYALFDSPTRDPFLNSASLSFLFHLQGQTLPDITPSSLIQHPFWLRTSLLPHMLHDFHLDHAHIAHTLLKRIPHSP